MSPAQAPSCLIRDRFGNEQKLSVKDGDGLLSVLTANRVPRNAVMSYVDGVLVPEQDVTLSEGKECILEAVRGYDLLGVRKLLNEEEKGAFYVKRFLSFDNDDVQKRFISMNKVEFTGFVHRTFIDSVMRHKLVSRGEKILVGFSGGRDSTMLMLLFEQLRQTIPDFELHASTLLGLPDWNDPQALSYTKEIARRGRVEYTFIQPEAIQEAFSLKASLEVSLNTLMKNNTERNWVIYMGHHVIRRMLEIKAAELGISKIILGLNSDDLLAGVLMAFTSGYLTSALQLRAVGRFTYAYPLIFLTKKELTMYIDAIEPRYLPQSRPTEFNMGPMSRSYYYALADYLQDVWPGIEHYMFKAYERICEQRVPTVQIDCRNCHAAVSIQGDRKSNLCDVCEIFRRNDLLS